MLGQWEQLQYEFNVQPQDFKIENIVFAGMGGSALAAELSTVWPGYSVPFEISRDYDLPNYVSNNSLVILSSYSGNTEETVSAFHQAIEKGSRIVVIASGGELQRLAQEHGYEFVALPGGLQPRHAVLYSFKALVTVLERYGLVEEESTNSAIIGATEFLKDSLHGWAGDVATESNQAKQIAEQMVGKTPIIYGSLLYPAAYKWKININENSKNTSWCNVYPEFNHNEFLGWSSHPIEKPFAVVDLISSFDHEQTKKRFVLSDRLLSGKRPKALQIQAKGEDVLQQLLWTVALGDMVSVYLAVLNGVNPTPVELIEKFKKEL